MAACGVRRVGSVALSSCFIRSRDATPLEDSIMAHTHEFDCKQCGAHLDSREDLERHNREQHLGASRRRAPQCVVA